MDAEQPANGAAALAAASLEGKAPESTDYANYFCTYSFLYHQKDMLEDHKRTGAYYNAVMQNRSQFHNKVVLDVGTGSGILAIFAAKAGARKVYAVEATGMANYARQLIEANKLSHIITVVQGMVESIELPEKVDIIISEWMGYFLLRESMLDSVIHARDRFLNPDGALYPSHARMYLAPIRTHLAQQRVNEFQNSMGGWADFIGDIKHYYGVDMNTLSDNYRTEQKDYYLHTSQWTEIHPSQLLGPPACFKSYDLKNVSLEELQAPLREEFVMHVMDGGPIEAFAGFFDTLFRGSPENPTSMEVNLSTAPDPTGCTHWGQQSFYVHPAIDCGPGDRLRCTIEVHRKKDNHRLLNIVLSIMLEGDSTWAQQWRSPRVLTWHIE